MKNFLKKKDTKGITLIALVITIIVLLILAGVTINSIVNQDSSMDKAAKARLENKRAEAKDAAALAVTELVQEYYEKRFIDSTSNASCPGEYVEEVLEEEDKTSGPYIISVESEILQVEDEDDVLATGTIEDSGAIVWDGTPRAVTASVNPWNNLATENDVAPADLFYYETMDEPQATGKVDGIEEKAKVADNSGNIKVADAETENYGTAKITGINVNKLAEAYSSDDYCKRYEYSSYDSSSHDWISWDDFFDRYSNAGVIGEYDNNEPSGTYYYDVSGSGPISINNYTGELQRDYDYSNRYKISYYNFWQEISSHDVEAFACREYRSDDWSYANKVAENIYNNNYSWNDDDMYCYVYYQGSEYEICRCKSDEYWNNADTMKTAIRNYMDEHPEYFKTKLVEARFLSDENWNSYMYGIYYEKGEEKRYFTTNSFSPYFISEYNNPPSYIEKLVFPSVYEDESTGKKYKITEINFSNKYGSDLVIPYVGNKISKFYIPNSVTSINFGYGGDYTYSKTIYLDTILIPGGIGNASDGADYFHDGTNVKKVVFGEGITSINADRLRWDCITDVYLPKSLTNITGTWDNNINVHYAGKKGAWSRVTGNKPKAEKVTFRSVYTDSSNN